MTLELSEVGQMIDATEVQMKDYRSLDRVVLQIGSDHILMDLDGRTYTYHEVSPDHGTLVHLCSLTPIEWAQWSFFVEAYRKEMEKFS